MRLTLFYETSGTALTLISLYLITEKYLTAGFIFGTLASLMWIMFAVNIKARYLLILNIILCLLHIKGIVM